MDNIKQEYFWFVIFSNIIEKRQLQLIQYNKHLQKILKINILNYRIFSGKYIEYESTTKGKIFDAYNDKLIFEGEFLNGKKMEKEKNIIMMAN